MKKIKEWFWRCLVALCCVVLLPVVILWFVFQVAYMWLMEGIANMLWKLDDEKTHKLWDELVEQVCDMHDSIKNIFSYMKLEL